MSFSEEIASIVRQTRDQLLPHWGIAEQVQDKGRGAMDFVTEMDLKIERFLAAELRKLDSGIEFAGEEYGGRRDAERFWLCDPIDGTIHFMRGTNFSSVMLALVEKGTVTLAYIYDFVNDDLYHAERGKGAYKNKERIHVSSRSAEQAIVGWETNMSRPENVEKFLAWTFPRTSSDFIRPTARLLCSGHEFVMVASGKLDGRIQFDPYGHDWDFAPGSLLVSEAGGVVANIGATTYDFKNRNFIAANRSVYEALTQGETAIFPRSI